MMKTQMGFAEREHVSKKRQTRREGFLSELERITPWDKLLQVFAPHHPEGERGRPQGAGEYAAHVRGAAVPGAVGGRHERCAVRQRAVRRFVGVDLSSEAAPDATTLLKFRWLPEAHDLTRAIFETINAHLSERGLMMGQGTMADATLIAAPSSTKNSTDQRDPEMHQTKKGNQWYFGMTSPPAAGAGRVATAVLSAAKDAAQPHKAHVGVDAATSLVHTVVTPPANVNDVTQAHALLHGKESDVWADAGYQEVDKRKEN